MGFEPTYFAVIRDSKTELYHDLHGAASLVSSRLGRNNRMTSTRWLTSLFTASLFAGCSSSALDPDHPSPVLDRGPHQGALRAISDKSGFIEVVTEPVRDAPSGSPKFRVAIYFLDRDQTGPLKPVPTDVSMTAAWTDAPDPKPFDLTIDPVIGDPAGAAKFVAPPLDHKGTPTGTLRAKVGDRAILASF